MVAGGQVGRGRGFIGGLSEAIFRGCKTNEFFKKNFRLNQTLWQPSIEKQRVSELLKKPDYTRKCVYRYVLFWVVLYCFMVKVIWFTKKTIIWIIFFFSFIWKVNKHKKIHRRLIQQASQKWIIRRYLWGYFL